MQLPGTNDVIGMWPAVWTMGNLGRAGYGASLDGMVPIPFFMYLISRTEHLILSYSGHIHMIVAMLEQRLIKRLTVYPTPQPLMVIISTTMCYPISLVKNFLVVHAMESHILAQSMLMGPMLVDLHPKSTC